MFKLNRAARIDALHLSSLKLIILYDTRDLIISDFNCFVVVNNPKQNNGFDCGIFVCLYLEYLINKNMQFFTMANQFFDKIRFYVNQTIENNTADRDIVYFRNEININESEINSIYSQNNNLTWEIINTIEFNQI